MRHIPRLIDSNKHDMTEKGARLGVLLRNIDPRESGNIANEEEIKQNATIERHINSRFH